MLRLSAGAAPEHPLLQTGLVSGLDQQANKIMHFENSKECPELIGLCTGAHAESSTAIFASRSNLTLNEAAKEAGPPGTSSSMEPMADKLALLQKQLSIESDLLDLAFGSSAKSEGTLKNMTMSEIDESDVLAAKKRLNFDEDSSMMLRLKNPVSIYAQGQARRQGHKLKKKLYPFSNSGETNSSLSKSHVKKST